MRPSLDAHQASSYHTYALFIAFTLTFFSAVTVAGGASANRTEDGSSRSMALAGRFRITRAAETEAGHSWKCSVVGRPAFSPIVEMAASASSPSDTAPSPFSSIIAISVAPNVTEPPASSISLSIRSTTEA
jgi:hypothetical protein